MDCQELHDALDRGKTAVNAIPCPKCLDMQLKTANIEKLNHTSSTSRLSSPSHNSTAVNSTAASPQICGCMEPLGSDVDGQETRQLESDSRIPQHRTSLQGDEERNNEKEGNESQQHDGQESLSLPVLEKIVRSATSEPVGLEDGPPSATEDDVQFLYSVPTRNNKKRQLPNESQSLERGVGSSRGVDEENLPAVVKDKVSAVVNPTVALIHSQAHTPPTPTEAQPSPTTPTLEKRKSSQPEKDLKMEEISTVGDGPATPKTTQRSLGLQTPSPSIYGKECTPESAQQSSTSVSPKTVMHQGFANPQGVAQMQPHTPIKAASHQYPVAMPNQIFQQTTAQQRALAHQYQTYQLYAAAQQMPFPQYMVPLPGQIQGYGVMQPQGPHMPPHMQGLQQAGNLKTTYQPGTNFVNTAQQGSGFQGNPLLFNPNAPFTPTTPKTPRKQTKKQPQNATDPTLAPMSSYPTNENIQRRPTLYGVPQWTAGTNTNHTVESDPQQAPKCSDAPNGSPERSKPPATIKPHQLGQPMYNGPMMTPYGLQMMAPTFAPSGQPYPIGPLQGTAPLQAVTQTYSSPYSQVTQQFQPQVAPVHTASAAPPMTTSGVARLPIPKTPQQSGNLLMDIALTCQRTFPFQDMAAQHGVSVQKVMDIFSAVIQIPLLKHANDERRYGKLGRERMKDWRTMNKEAEELHREVDELNGVVHKTGPAKRGRKRKVDEIMALQNTGETPSAHPEKLQKIGESQSEDNAMWVRKLFGESDALIGDMTQNGGGAARN